MVAIDLGGVRSNLPLRHLSDGVSEVRMVGRQIQVH